MQGVQSVRCYSAPNLISHLSQIALTPRTTCNVTSCLRRRGMNLRLIATGWFESETFEGLSKLLTLSNQEIDMYQTHDFKTSCNYVSDTWQSWNSINSRLEIGLFLLTLRQGGRPLLIVNDDEFAQKHGRRRTSKTVFLLAGIRGTSPRSRHGRIR